MADGGVFAVGGFCHAADAAGEGGGLIRLRGDAVDVEKPQLPEIWGRKSGVLPDGGEGVAAGVSEADGVWEFADAEAVKNDEEDAFHCFCPPSGSRPMSFKTTHMAGPERKAAETVPMPKAPPIRAPAMTQKMSKPTLNQRRARGVCS